MCIECMCVELFFVYTAKFRSCPTLTVVDEIYFIFKEKMIAEDNFL